MGALRHAPSVYHRDLAAGAKLDQEVRAVKELRDPGQPQPHRLFHSLLVQP